MPILVLEVFVLVPAGLAYLAGILLLLFVARRDDRLRKSGRAWRLPASILAVGGFGVICSQVPLLWVLFLLPLWYAVGMPIALLASLVGLNP